MATRVSFGKTARHASCQLTVGGIAGAVAFATNGGAGKVSQSTRSQASFVQSDFHTVMRRSAPHASHVAAAQLAGSNAPLSVVSKPVMRAPLWSENTRKVLPADALLTTMTPLALAEMMTRESEEYLFPWQDRHRFMRGDT